MKKDKKSLNYDYISDILSYCPLSGDLRWKHRNANHFSCKRSMKIWNTRFAGKIAGTPHSQGYVSIMIKGIPRLAHRIAWLLENKEFPAEELDHIDGNRANNKISNLRSVTRKENCKNLRKSSSNTSGINGVSWAAHAKKWVARIQVDYKYIHLGYFSAKIDAFTARYEAEKKYGFHNNHGRI